MTEILLLPSTPFWVVTYPGRLSTIEDICFRTDLAGLRRQFLGGLTAEEINGLYLTEDEARKVAESLLLERL